MGYAVVLGEALIDLLAGECAGEPVYRPMIGGGPLNVAVGLARLGGAAEFIGALGDDAFAAQIRDFLEDTGVGTQGVVTVAAPTALAVTTFDGAEPEFRFYGDPPAYGLLAPDLVDRELVARSAVLYCGSIALLCPLTLDAARHAWLLASGLRVFDPNVRPRLLPDQAALENLRAVVTEFAANADLVKLSHADAEVLYPGASAEEVAIRLRGLGADVVVVTLGAQGALVMTGTEATRVPAPVVSAIDATGAGDSVMAALIAELLVEDGPVRPESWPDRVRFALRVAGLVCESPGASAVPTRDQVAARFGAPG